MSDGRKVGKGSCGQTPEGRGVQHTGALKVSECLSAGTRARASLNTQREQGDDRPGARTEARAS